MKVDFDASGLIGFAVAVLGATALHAGAIAQTSPVPADLDWYNCLTDEVFPPEKQAWCDRWQTLQSATYVVPTSLEDNPAYTTVTLEAGRYQLENGQFVVELIDEAGWLTFGDIDNDGQEDAAVILGIGLDPQLRSVGTYLSAVMDIDGEAQALRPVKLGERILLNGPIYIDNSRITVPLLTQTEAYDREFVVDSTSVSELVPLPGPVETETPETETPETETSLPTGTLVYSQTADLALRVYNADGQPRLNLFNKATGITELSGAPLSVETTPAAMIYRHGGELPVQITVTQAGEQTILVNGNPLENSESLTGTVTYRPRIALPPNAVVEVKLVDVSRADAPAVTLASQQFATDGRQVPLPFELIYDPEQIDPRLSYAVQAQITVDEDLSFITTRHYPVITGDNPTTVEVLVDPISR